MAPPKMTGEMTELLRASLRSSGFDQVELLGRTGAVRTLRATRLPGGAPVILRLYEDGPAAAERMERERVFLLSLSSEHVPAPAGLIDGGVRALVFDDAAFRPLRGPAALTLDQFLPIAFSMAAAVQALHLADRLHLTLSPDSFLVDERSGRAVLVDLGSACGAPPAAPRSGLPYLAPESTAPTAGAPDQRSDLYGLGAVFHELLAGVAPFDDQDEQRLIHALLAREPAPLGSRRPDLPDRLCELVDRLLRKDPVDRLPSCRSLVDALERARSRHAADGEGPVPAEGGAGLHHRLDERASLAAPDALYGRAAELEALRGALPPVLAGRVLMVFVAGCSGAGKTALIERFLRESPGVLPLRGKFDQFHSESPYSAIAEALNAAVHDMLTEPEEALAARRAALHEALAGNGAVIRGLVPDLELLLGPQASPPTVGPVESQRRFERAACAFVRALTSPQRPAVLFLDDLQWADPASLELVRVLLTQLSRAGLLVVAAYRDDEVAPGHPVLELRRQLAGQGVELVDVHVGPLRTAAIAEIYARMLDSRRVDVVELAASAQVCTEGNVLFAIELLKQLYSHDRLQRGADGGWHWHRQGELAVELGSMRGALDDLPHETRRVLATAACLGDRLDLDTLAQLRGEPPDAIRLALTPAVVAQLVVPEGGSASAPRLVFRHDKLRRAAHELNTAHERARVHLAAARLMAAGDPSRPEELFRLVAHYGEAAELVADRQERLAVVRLQLRAARNAQRSNAYRAAISYLEAALGGLRRGGRDPWDEDHGLCMAVHRALAENSFLAGRFEATEQVAREALQRAGDPLDAAQLYRLLVVMHTVQSTYEDAIRLGREGLRALGIEVPEHDLRAHLDAELEAAATALAGRPIESLIDMEECGSPRSRLAMSLLVDLAPPAWMTHPELYAVLVARAAALCLAEGVTDQSANIFATYGLILATERDQARQGHAFGRLALAFCERFDNDADRCKASCMFTGHVNHWVRHVAETNEIALNGIAAGRRSGEIQWAGYLSQWTVVNLLCQGAPLAEVRPVLERLLEFNTAARHELIIDTLDGLGLILDQLCAGAEHPEAEARFQAQHRAFVERCLNHRSELSLCNYFLFLAQLQLLLDRPEAALRSADRAGDYASYSRGTFTLGEIPFYRGLARVELLRSGSWPASPEQLALLAADADALRRLAAQAPSNFRCRQLLLDAERSTLTGEVDVALYDRAIREARRERFVQVEALASELAARVQLAADHQSLARILVVEAERLYQAWGCGRKVAELRRRHPTWLHGPPVAAPAATAAEGSDLATLLEASQALASRIELDAVLDKVLELGLVNAGAQRGGLFVRQGVGWRLQALAQADRGGVERLPVEALWPEHARPSRLLEYVARTREPAVMGEASGFDCFGSDAYFAGNPVRSAMCLPLVLRDQVTALLYLESDLISGAFRTSRVALLRLLLVNMAAALENASLLARTREQMALRERLERQLQQAHRLEAIGTLAGGVAHDFKNLLTPILGWADILSFKLPPGDPCQEGVAQIRSAASRANELVGQILAISRRSENAAEKVHLPRVVDEVLRLMGSSLPAGVEVQREVDAESPPVLAQAAQLHQILMNLLTNSLQALPDRRGRITVGVRRLAAGDAHELGMEAARHVTLWVEDTGPGIPEAVLDRIFEPYFTTKSAEGGTGLGLAVAQGIVQGYGGRIHARNMPGGGARLCVILPMAEPTPAVELEPDAPVTADQAEAVGAVPGGEHIFCVDDEPQVLEAWEAILRSLGYRVTTCHDALEAKLRLESAPGAFDLIISDQSMPGMAGDALATALRAAGVEAPILIMSGNLGAVDPGVFSSGIVQGGLEKPVTRRELDRVIRALLDRPEPLD